MENLVHRSDMLGRFLSRVANHIDRALIGTPLGRKLPSAKIHEASDALDAFQEYLDGVGNACARGRFF